MGRQGRAGKELSSIINNSDFNDFIQHNKEMCDINYYLFSIQKGGAE